MNSAVHKIEPSADLSEALEQVLADNFRLHAEVAALQSRIGELEHLADTDTLTPLPNRRAFFREVSRVVKRVDRHGTAAIIMFVDVVGLKAINDRWGHSAGDAALEQVADVLRREVRETDMVARIGGDEFGLLLDHLDEVGALAKAEALVAAVSLEPLTFEDKQIELRLSVGFARIDADDTPESALSRADARMYASRSVQRSER